MITLIEQYAVFSLDDPMCGDGSLRLDVTRVTRKDPRLSEEAILRFRNPTPDRSFRDQRSRTKPNDRIMSSSNESPHNKKFISVDAIQSMLPEENCRLSLVAVPCEEATEARPRWTMELRDDTGHRYTVKTQGSHCRPMYASTPSGVYGIAAEIGIDQVVLCIPQG